MWESHGLFPLPFRLAACLRNRNRLKDLENKLMVTKGRGWGSYEGQTEGLGLTGVCTALFKRRAVCMPRRLGGEDSARQCRRRGLRSLVGKVPPAKKQVSPSTAVLSLRSEPRRWSPAWPDDACSETPSLTLERGLHSR